MTCLQRDCLDRSILLRAETANDATRSVEAVIATADPVSVYDAGIGRVIDEVLLPEGLRADKQVPLLSQHVRTLDGILGSARNIRAEKSRVVATLYFADDPDSERVWAKVRDGHITDVSAGYSIAKATEILPGQAATIAGRSYASKHRTLRVVTEWTLRECSIVSIGADPRAKTRSDSLPPSYKETNTMSIHTTASPEEKLRSVIQPLMQRNHAVRWADVGKAALQHLGHSAPEGDSNIVRAMTANATIADAIDSAFSAEFLAAAVGEPDTTREWTREMSSPNFRQSELYAFATGGRLERVHRGDAAHEDNCDLAKTTFRVARFGKRLEVDEQDMTDGQSIGAILQLVRQMGAEASRVRPDLVYSLLLENPTLAYDSVALFDDTDHANLGTAALASTSIDDAIAAIGNQSLTDQGGRPIHLNNQGRLLIVPPDLTATARGLARDLQLGDGQDIKVLQESRLSATGVYDPANETTRTGSATNWLLAASASSMPAIVVVARDGVFTPRLRRYALSQGEWGFGWDVSLDLTVVACSHFGLYWSTGVGGE